MFSSLSLRGIRVLPAGSTPMCRRRRRSLSTPVSAKGQNVDLEPIGRKAIGFYKRRFAAAQYEKTEEHYDNDLSTHYETIRHRAQQIEVAAEHADLLMQVELC